MAGIRKMITRPHEELGKYEALRLHRDLKQKRKSDWPEFVASTAVAWHGDLVRPPQGYYGQRYDLAAEFGSIREDLAKQGPPIGPYDLKALIHPCQVCAGPGAFVRSANAKISRFVTCLKTLARCGRVPK